MRSTLIDHSYVRDVVQKCATCIGPVKDAEILPAEAYVSEEFWEFEKRAIFARECQQTKRTRPRTTNLLARQFATIYSQFYSRRAN